ncbi:MAG: tetratricopeptide repeat protein [Candidatus Nitrosopolaris sp.]
MCKQTRTKDHTICDIELGNNPDKALNGSAENGITLLNKKADALFELGNYTGAIKYYDKALKIASASTSAREGKIHTLLALNNSTKR